MPKKYSKYLLKEQSGNLDMVRAQAAQSGVDFDKLPPEIQNRLGSIASSWQQNQQAYQDLASREASINSQINLLSNQPMTPETQQTLAQLQNQLQSTRMGLDQVKSGMAELEAAGKEIEPAVTQMRDSGQAAAPVDAPTGEPIRIGPDIKSGIDSAVDWTGDKLRVAKDFWADKLKPTPEPTPQFTPYKDPGGYWQDTYQEPPKPGSVDYTPPESRFAGVTPPAHAGMQHEVPPETRFAGVTPPPEAMYPPGGYEADVTPVYQDTIGDKLGRVFGPTVDKAKELGGQAYEKGGEMLKTAKDYWFPEKPVAKSWASGEGELSAADPKATPTLPSNYQPQAQTAMPQSGAPELAGPPPPQPQQDPTLMQKAGELASQYGPEAAAAGAAGAAVLGAYKLYKQFFSKAARACKDAPDKSECMQQYRTQGVQAAINSLKRQAPKCGNDQKCVQKIQSAISRLEGQLGS